MQIMAPGYAVEILKPSFDCLSIWVLPKLPNHRVIPSFNGGWQDE
jgi:hypothetical protein